MKRSYSMLMCFFCFVCGSLNGISTVVSYQYFLAYNTFSENHYLKLSIMYGTFAILCFIAVILSLLLTKKTKVE